MKAGWRSTTRALPARCGSGSRRCGRRMPPSSSPRNRSPTSTYQASRRPSSKAARPGYYCRTSARSSRRYQPSIAALDSTTGRSRFSRAPRRSAIITASRDAATGCSSSALVKSRSPSAQRPPRPIRPESRACSPNMAATGLWPPGCACVARAGPPISSPTFATWRYLHDQAPSSGGGERRRALTYRGRIATLHANVGAGNRVRPQQLRTECLDRSSELQQINHQITALQNQAQMLINQARNLASLPYSSLQQLQSSIQRTQQLLAQAQNIAFNVQQIDHAFQTTYGSANASQSSQTLIANAQARWQNSVAALQDSLRVQAGVVGNLDNNRTQMSALVTSSQSATGGLAATQAGNQLLALQAQQLADLTAAVAAQGAHSRF